MILHSIKFNKYSYGLLIISVTSNVSIPLDIMERSNSHTWVPIDEVMKFENDKKSDIVNQYKKSISEPAYSAYMEMHSDPPTTYQNIVYSMSVDLMKRETLLLNIYRVLAYLYPDYPKINENVNTLSSFDNYYKKNNKHAILVDKYSQYHSKYFDPTFFNNEPIANSIFNLNRVKIHPQSCSKIFAKFNTLINRTKKE